MSLIKLKEENQKPSLFSDFFSTDFFNDDAFNREITKWVPATNIKENSSNYTVELSAPGMSKSDFKIEVKENVLSVEGNQKEQHEEKNERYTRKEFRTTSFIRSFRMPNEVNADKIDAKYENGILKLVLPKREDAKTVGPKEVKIS